MTSRSIFARAEPGLPTQRFAVSDALHSGVVACSMRTSLRSAARMLAENRAQAMLVFGRSTDDGPPASACGIVSDDDLVKAVVGRDLDDTTAGDVAHFPIRSVEPDEPLSAAVLMMVVNGSPYVTVVGRDGLPVGILSAFDVARTVAGYD